MEKTFCLKIDEHLDGRKNIFGKIDIHIDSTQSLFICD